jgi:RNA recognition motif-containing protein
MQSNLYVTNLSYTIDGDALRAHFGGCGDVVAADIIMDRETGRSRGFGFVEMSTARAGESHRNAERPAAWVVALWSGLARPRK